MDVGAVNKKGKKGDKGKGKDGKGKGKKGHEGKGPSPSKSATSNAEKECFYCKKKGHIKAECRKRIKDLKNAERRPAGGTAAAESGKGSSASMQRNPVAAPAGGVVSDEFVAALPLDDPLVSIVGSVQRDPKLILVDSGCGAHIFPKDYDPMASHGSAQRSSMSTVTGETLAVGGAKRSCFKLRDSHKTLKLDYREVDSVDFPILSVGSASEKGIWLVIGPQSHHLIHPSEGQLIEKAVASCANRTPLKKDRGVYWLEVEDSIYDCSTQAAIVAGAARGVRNRVPVEVSQRLKHQGSQKAFRMRINNEISS